jgi:hypothetical protein
MKCYIDGIFNYCDRWCERCSFTSRCRSFALEEKIMKAEKDGTIDNDTFWKIFDSVYDYPVSKESDTGDLDEFDSDEPPDDIESLDLNSWQENRNDKRGTNFVFMAARSYSTDVDSWIKQYENEINNSFEKEKITYVKVQDALELVLHYAFFIPIKLSRAINGLQDEFTEVEEDSDANGSAKVALLAISRSINGWSIIRSVFKKDQDMTARFIGMLIGIRRATEQMFPGAMKFIRPGFDSEESAKSEL